MIKPPRKVLLARRTLRRLASRKKRNTAQRERPQRLPRWVFSAYDPRRRLGALKNLVPRDLASRIRQADALLKGIPDTRNPEIDNRVSEMTDNIGTFFERCSADQQALRNEGPQMLLDAEQAIKGAYGALKVRGN